MIGGGVIAATITCGQRFRLAHSCGFSAFTLLDDGRIFWEPRDSCLPVVATQGIEPPLRVWLLRREKAQAFLMLAATCTGLFACELVVLAVAQWLAWRP